MHVRPVYFNCTVNRAASDNQAIMNCKWSRVIDWPSTASGAANVDASSSGSLFACGGL